MNEQTQERLSLIVDQMKKAEGVTNDLIFYLTICSYNESVI